MQVSLEGAQSSRTLTDGISPMPPVPANQSPPMQRNSIIAQDMSSFTFSQHTTATDTASSRASTRPYCFTRRKSRTLKH